MKRESKPGYESGDERIGVGVVEQTLDRRQDGSDVVRRTPPVLEDVKTELPVGVDVGVEHLGEEADGRGLVGVRLLEGERQPERPIFKRRLG